MLLAYHFSEEGSPFDFCPHRIPYSANPGAKTVVLSMAGDTYSSYRCRGRETESFGDPWGLFGSQSSQTQFITWRRKSICSILCQNNRTESLTCPSLGYFCLAPQRAVVVAAVPNEIREEGEAWGKHRHLRVNGREEKRLTWQRTL